MLILEKLHGKELVKWVKRYYKAPEMLSEVIHIAPPVLDITHLVRMKCQNCGAWKRKRDCPPYAPKLETCKERIFKRDKIFLFVWKSDGSIPWREGLDPEKLVQKKERGLKGCAIGMQVSIHNFMLQMKEHWQVKGYSPLCFVAGPCHKCRVCNTEGPCLKGGSLPSMEAWGIDVYGLMDKLKIEYQHPVIDYITCCSMLCLGQKDERHE